MSKTYEGGPITVQAVGVTAATGAASARSAIPVNLAGDIPRYIRVTGINECYVKLGTVAVVATGNDMLVQPGDGVIMTTNGMTHIAYIQGTLAGKVNVVPLEAS